ncbi:MAG: o-succinylbenzoate synthase [Acidimicrobiia bacterium]
MPPALAAVPVDIVEVHRVALRLSTPFRTAHMALDEREIVLVRVAGNDGDGWGECSALPTSDYPGGDLDSAHRYLLDDLGPHLLHAGTVDPGALPRSGPPTARAAVECALLDCALRRVDTSLAAFLGGSRGRVPAGAVLGFADEPDTAAEASDLARRGYGAVKCKIGPGHDVNLLTAVRRAVGPDVALSADANGAYNSGNPAHRATLTEIDSMGLTYLEQPVASDDLAGLVELTRSLETPILLDESAPTLAETTAALDAGAGDAVSVKAPRIGGVLEARRTHDLCVERGIGVVAGGFLESGIGRAAAVALASLPGFRAPGDLSASDRYFVADVTEPFELVDGELTVPNAPGLGRHPRPGALRSLAVTTESLRRP